MSFHFMVHEPGDGVGVIVVEGVQSGQGLSGWILANNETVDVTTTQDIPMGHKVALMDLPDGADVIEYGHVIGRTVAPIQTGEHVHVHNVKTKKW